MTNEMKSELIVFFLLVCALGSVWYYAWIKPADDMRHQIMDCMQTVGNNSFESYKECKDQLRSEVN